MIHTSAKVVQSQNGIIWLEPTVESGCGGCQVRSSCGVSKLGKYFTPRRQLIQLQCVTPVTAGKELQISLRESDLLKAGLMMYLLPAVLALLGAGTASVLGMGDLGAVLGMVLGGVLAFVLAQLSGWKPHLVVQTKI